MRYGAGCRLIAVTALLLGPVAAGRAEDEDAPGRGVARISVVNGDVSVRRGDSGDWVAAAVNAPLVVPDAIATGPNSRAEVQLDYANIVRLGPNAEVRLTELENRRYQVQVARGTVVYRVLRDTDADIDVSTPQVSVRPSRKGAYRITVYDDGQQAEIAVRSGEAEIYTPRGVERLGSGRSMLVRGGPSEPEYQFASAPPRDDIDRWSEDRDRYLERSASYRYVSPSIYGAEDLDAHGRWVYDPPYGWVWVPRTGPGWAPYSHGRWVWQDWYGWTWLSYDPWGWAPFHYGRWYHGHHGWCWYPGPRVSVHFWRPALVAFFGVGHGVHVGVSFGRVGWVPLAPHEPFYPWYGRRYYGRGGFVDRSIHVTNINVVNVYRNARVRHAVSAVDYEGFGRGRHRIHRIAEVREASLMKGPLPVAPGRESIRFSDREVRSVPRSAGAEKFFARRQPTPVHRVSFADQQRNFRTAAAPAAARPVVARGEGAARSSGGWRRTSEAAPAPAIRPAAPAARGTTAGRSEGNRGSESGSGWRRFGDRPQTAAPARGGEGIVRTPGGSDGRGSDWRRFGESSAREVQAAPVRRTEDTVRNQPRESESRGGSWRRFGEPSRAAPARPSSGASSTPSRGRSWGSFGVPSQGRESGRSFDDSRRGSDRVGRSESIRIAPPVVRERTPQVQSAPRSVPRSESYRRSESAPRPQSYSRGSSGSSQPRSYSRGSSGGSRSSGSYSRGSGSSRSSGGGSRGHGSGRGR